jgi:hypothetical protein
MVMDAEKLITVVEKRPALYNYLLQQHHLEDVIENTGMKLPGKWVLQVSEDALRDAFFFHPCITSPNNTTIAQQYPYHLPP